jgi:ABC-type branched-subunit amino acid transport system substrate-binding protein
MVNSRFLLSFVLLPALLLPTEAPSRQTTGYLGKSCPVPVQCHPDITPEMKDPNNRFIAVIGPIESSPDTTRHLGRSFFRGVYQTFLKNKEKLDGWKIGYYFLDDQSNSNRTGDFAKQLRNLPNCLGIIGSVDSHATMEIIKANQESENRTPLLSPVSTAITIEKGHDMVWMVNPTNEDMIEKGLRELARYKGKEYSNLYLTSVYMNILYGQGAHKVLKSLVKSSPSKKDEYSGIKYHYVEEEGYTYNCPVDSVDCESAPRRKEIVMNLKNKIDQKRRDQRDQLHQSYENVVIGLFDATELAGLMAKEIQDQLPGITIFTTSAGGTQTFLKKAGEAAEGVIVLTPYNPNFNEEFKREFKEKYSVPPDTFAAQGHDGVCLFIDVLTRLDAKKEPHTRQKIIDELNKKEARCTGAISTLSFSPDSRKVVMLIHAMKWKRHDLVPIDSLSPPPTDSRVLTVIAALIVIILFAVLARWFHVGASRWVPLLTTIVLSGSLQSGWIPWLAEERGLFFTIVIAVFLVAIISGGLSPRMFREIARIQPFQLIASLVLRSSRFRRRYFRDYINDLSLVLDGQKIDAREKYVPIPALIHERGNVEPTLEPEPAGRIKEILVNRRPKARKHVIIEAPGGHGKSALFREVIRSMCDAHRNNHRIPLPVLCSDSGGEIEKMVARALAESHIDNSFLKEMLEAGDFVIFIDDPSEMMVKAETIKTLVKSTAGRHSRLVVAMRPDENLRKAFEVSVSWTRFEPLPLTEKTLAEFVKVYGRSSLDDSVKEACRSRGGNYLQILVKLAIIIGDEKGVTSKKDLYRRALNRLLMNKFGSELADKIDGMAIDLCLKTYWENGSRQLAYTRRDNEDRRTIKLLRTAGILIDTDSIHLKVEGDEPETVRFFHDSIQSYLTARGLDDLPESEKDKNVLWKAAGHEQFLDASIDEQAASQSELFEMCVEVFNNKDKLLKDMVRDLSDWADQYGSDLTKNKVLEAVPSDTSDPSKPVDLRKQTDDLTPGDYGAGFALKKAVCVCLGYADCESRDVSYHAVRVNGNNLRYIAKLYSGLAPITWELKLKRERLYRRADGSFSSLVPL